MTPSDHVLLRSPETSPADIYRCRDGIYAVELLIVAITELDLFTLLSRESLDLEQLCRRLDLEARPAHVMVTLLVAMGLIERRDGRCEPTPTAREHLSADSPWYLGPYYGSLKDRDFCRALVEVLRTGRPANWTARKKIWEGAMEEEEFAASFTREMDCRGLYLGPRMAARLDCRGRERLLDIGGGSGVYACSVAVRHGHMNATVLEKPPVDAIARHYIEERGLAGRVGVVTGDMFGDELPRGFDVHLYSNVFHDWDERRVLELLTKSFAALPDGGVVAVHDAHLDRDKSGPLEVAEYSVLLMCFTEGRCYSVGEMEELLGEAGFGEVRREEVGAARSLITAMKGG